MLSIYWIQMEYHFISFDNNNLKIQHFTRKLKVLCVKNNESKIQILLEWPLLLGRDTL